MKSTENEERKEPRTESILDGTLVQYVLLSPTGVRIYRKDGSITDIKSPDARKSLDIVYNIKA
jgi:hypothetical protein